jgi:uncharacterized membrane protein YedE/YeeE
MAVTGWSTGRVVIVYEVAMLSILTAILAYAPRSVTLLHPVVGGLVIGLGQFASVILANKPVGVSSVYQDFGNTFWSVINGTLPKAIPDSILFAGGLMVGSWLTIFNVPAIREAMIRSDTPSLPITLMGGLFLTFGARIAGGCTSGHGISGMASMGLSSFITIISMFGAGIMAGMLAF